MFSNDSVRLNKYISESGVCSRREADRYIEQGNVLINGKRAKVGQQVTAGDKVMVNGQTIEPKEKEEAVFLAFNKPVGITSTTEAGTKGNIVDYVNHSERIFPVGRLDKDSQGLIFLTNNGDIVNKILRAGNRHEKEYIVTVNKPVTDQFITAMGNGVPVLGGMTKKCLVSKESPFIFKITLIQGMNRQIRRMCEYFEYEVTKLERVRIMNVSLKGLPLGEWRELTGQELAGIFKLIENSSSEADLPAKRSTKKKTGNWEEQPKRTNSNRDEKPGKNTGKSFGRPKPGTGAKSFTASGRPGKARPKGNGPVKSAARIGKSKPPAGRGKGRARR